ncbi:hypothetical protein PC116_g4204 [Phytophthora cactorum]|uniref:Uncharacterized protein n=1 Tax=Phytophthora cactorum TaxID=29920 RepID=A0A8T1ECV2_9STRA|nr:hypothetical protein Pcac1_g24878 [Phytophthora cactorum]KAG2915724.1 hypothetical protein PC114_g7719 [Phytophthora cactorum]KAG2952555.1 hypothetical protein PC117_g2746 [Phytophthora cactorum]KAG3029653.1 hypothetical protein PC120_g4207 [Phytophthora cactorum]KAG3029923.1 hypothetical protein PC119_g6444 [Phytophthora cactorum]
MFDARVVLGHYWQPFRWPFDAPHGTKNLSVTMAGGSAQADGHHGKQKLQSEWRAVTVACA